MSASIFQQISISILDDSHDVIDFDCGDEKRNSWLKIRAFSSDEQHDSRTYVAALGSAVVGYYALAVSSIVRGTLPGSMRRNAPDPVGGILLAQLAVDLKQQGHGLGRELVLHAMEQAVKVTEIAGSRLFMVHPATPELAAYYEKFGFASIDTAPASMAMTMRKVENTLTALAAAR